MKWKGEQQEGGEKEGVGDGLEETGGRMEERQHLRWQGSPHVLAKRL